MAFLPKDTFKAAEYYFNDNLVPAYAKRDINAYNVSVGLSHLSGALEQEFYSLNARLDRIEKLLQRPK